MKLKIILSLVLILLYLISSKTVLASSNNLNKTTVGLSLKYPKSWVIQSQNENNVIFVFQDKLKKANTLSINRTSPDLIKTINDNKVSFKEFMKRIKAKTSKFVSINGYESSGQVCAEQGPCRLDTSFYSQNWWKKFDVLLVSDFDPQNSKDALKQTRQMLGTMKVK